MRLSFYSVLAYSELGPGMPTLLACTIPTVPIMRLLSPHLLLRLNNPLAGNAIDIPFVLPILESSLKNIEVFHVLPQSICIRICFARILLDVCAAAIRSAELHEPVCNHRRVGEAARWTGDGGRW